MADGGKSTQDRTLAAQLAIDMAEHMALDRGLLSMSPTILTAGVGQKEDMGDGVVNLNAAGATEGCIMKRELKIPGVVDTGDCSQPDQDGLSTGVIGVCCICRSCMSLNMASESSSADERGEHVR